MDFWSQVVSFINDDLPQRNLDELLKWAEFWVSEGGFWLFPTLAGYLKKRKESLPFEDIRYGLSNTLMAFLVQYETAKEVFESAEPKEKHSLLVTELSKLQKACSDFLGILASSEKALLRLGKAEAFWFQKKEKLLKFFTPGLTTIEIECHKKPIPLWIKEDSSEEIDHAAYRLEDITGIFGLLCDRLPKLDLDYLGFCPVCFKIFWKSRKDKVFCQRKCQSLYFVRRARKMGKKSRSEEEA